MLLIVLLHTDVPETRRCRRAVNLVEMVGQLGDGNLINRNLAYLRHLSVHHLAAVVDDSSHLRRL